MTRRPEWAAEPLMVSVDGPMAGQWFTADDWAARLESAEYMVGHGQPRAAALGYSPTTTAVSHPFVDDLTGVAWTCLSAPGEAAVREDSADEAVADSFQERQLDQDEWWA